MSRKNFNKDIIRDFTTTKAQEFLWDTGSPGLGLRATASGQKAFIFQSKLGRATIRMTIGDPNTWKLDAARKEARRLKMLVDTGVDPRTVKAEQIKAQHEAAAEARKAGATVAQAWDAYLADRKPKWGERHYHDHLRLAQGSTLTKSGKMTTPGPLHTLMDKRLSDLTPDLMAAWLETETCKRPTSAALSYRLLRAFVHWCDEQGEYSAVDKGAVTAKKTREAVPRARAKDGDCLQREQLKIWFDAVHKAGNPITAAYLQCLLLTGARREEMLSLRWEDVDFQWRTLEIGDKATRKGGQEGTRQIPIAPYVAQLLASLPRRNKWVFSSAQTQDGRISEPREVHARALQGAGLPHITIHGLRRSFGTLAEWTEMPVGIVAQIQGHKPSAIAEKHYRRRPLDLLRLWLTKYEAWILEQAGLEQPAEDQKPLHVVGGAK